MKRWLYIVLLLFAQMTVWANGDTLSIAERNAMQGFNDTIDRSADDFVIVSLVVCDPGEVLYSALGHAALHLQCPTFNLDYIFSYESESVLEKIWTFLKGNLKMGMFSMTPEVFLKPYRESGRGVYEYTINLNPEQKQELWRVMDEKVAKGANLPYDYFRRGCAKSVVRVIHEAIGSNTIHYAPWPDKYTKQTQRELVRNYITEAPWEEFVMYFLIGAEGDKSYPCEKKLIVPTDLVEVWQKATFDNGRPVLGGEARTLLGSTKHNHGTWCTPLLISILLLVMALFSFGSIWLNGTSAYVAGQLIDNTILTIFTIIGAGMTYLILFSGLPCTSWNWLIIPFNILPAIFWRWRKYWAFLYAIVCTVWIIGMLVYPHWIVDWAHIILVCSFVMVLIKQWQYHRVKSTAQ